MNKILIIGQAPPAHKQKFPYDSTMLYDWLSEVGISIETAQQMFEFEAVCGVFTGFENGGHKKPSKEQMDEHWEEVLQEKVQSVNKVILLGNVAKEYFWSKPKTWSCSLEVLELIHPSRRNYNLYKNNKEQIVKQLRDFIDS